MIAFRGIEIPELGELSIRPRGIVAHWTGGGPRANSTDRKAYHAIAEHDGDIVAGIPFERNFRSPLPSGYAAHTGGFNTGRAGFAWAGMAGYTGRRGSETSAITEIAFEAGCEFLAVLCRAWALLPMNPDDLCTHLEVWTVHQVRGKRNHEKTDIEYLPFRPDLGRDEVGPYLRSRVETYRVQTPAIEATRGTGALVSATLPLLQRGDNDAAVRRLQLAIGVEPVGKSGPSPFGPATDAAVREFQKRAGLTSDGVVGPLTWEALFSRI